MLIVLGLLSTFRAQQLAIVSGPALLHRNGFSHVEIYYK